MPGSLLAEGLSAGLLWGTGGKRLEWEWLRSFGAGEGARMSEGLGAGAFLKRMILVRLFEMVLLMRRMLERRSWVR